VLDQIGAQQEAVAGRHHLSQRRQELPARARGEITDGRAQESNQSPSTARYFGQMLLEVAAYGVDLDTRVLLDDRSAGRLQHARVDVERDEAPQRAAAVQRIEQHPRLLR